MKKIFHIILFTFFAQITWAQENKLPNQHEFGINTNLLLEKLIFRNSAKDFVTFSGNLNVPAIYNNWLTYRYYYAGGKFAFRTGLGYYFHENRDSSISVFQESHFSESVRQFSAFLGYQKQFLLGKKVQAYTGLDLFYTRKNDIQKGEERSVGGFFQNEFTYKNTLLNNYIGIRMPIGVQFYINKRISLSTEMYVEGFTRFRKEKFENSNSPEPNEQEGNRITQFSFQRPLILYLNYRF